MSSANATSTSDIVIPQDVPRDRAWYWLELGWKDLWRHPTLSLGYGLVFVLVGGAITYGLWQAGLSSTIPIAIGGFALVGPMMAVGLYEMSRRMQFDLPVRLNNIIFVKAASPIHLLYIGFVLLFAFLVWSRIAIMLYALFVSSTYLPLNDFSQFLLGTPQGLAMMVIGTVIGGGIALTIFAMTALSVPLLLDRNMDAMEAVVRSVQVVMKNPKPLLCWAWIIAMLIAVGTITAFIGLVVVFPLLGHATWHAYDDLLGAQKRD